MGSTTTAANSAVIHFKLSESDGVDQLWFDSSGEAELCSSNLEPSTIPEAVIVYNDTDGLRVRNILLETPPGVDSFQDGTYLVYLTEQQRSYYEQALCKRIDRTGSNLPESVVWVCVVPQVMMDNKPPSHIKLRMAPLRPIASGEGLAFTEMMRELLSINMTYLDPCLLTDSFLRVKCKIVDEQPRWHHLKELNLTSRGLNGTLRASITSFAHLELLVLTDNALHFSLEAVTENNTSPSMPSLREIYLGNNRFGDGNLTAETFRQQLQTLVNRSRLECLHLENNNLQMLDFNTTFYDFENLTYLNIAGNNFTGEVDAERFKDTKICVWAGNQNLKLNFHEDWCKPPDAGSASQKHGSQVFMFMGIAVGVVLVITGALFLALYTVRKPRVCPKKCAREREEEPLCHFLLESRFRASGETRPAGVARQASNKAAGFLRKPRLHFHSTESPWKLTLEDIADATSCFETLLAKGSFGDAFKGIINKNDVAVKFRAKTSFAAVMSNFQKDLESITSLNHENLAKVLGFCDSEHYQSLVIEYFPKGSLEDHLHGTKTKLELWRHSQQFPVLLDGSGGASSVYVGCSWEKKINKDTAFPATVVQLEWSHADRRMQQSVVGELDVGEAVNPILLMRTDERTKHHLSGLMCALRLPVRLWMLSRTSFHLRVGFLHERSPECRHEASVVVADDVFRYAVAANPAGVQEALKFGSSGVVLAREKLRVLTQTVNDREDAVVPEAVAGKRTGDAHGNGEAGFPRDRHRAQLAVGIAVAGLASSANFARVAIPSDIGNGVGPSKSLPKSCNSAIDSEMACESRVMALAEKASPKTTVSWDTQ
ncbi:hypothetical protein CBR_g29452 [Chara braunii]|uniref:Serine-threonine/tyrosine-protein kinase catalytic domain-containing protein n=1 Tax=Chara braunii TaxID=69332 RepID=A0A388LAU2_CHABU|nr:hypothetical protein CBR_g29452 [Chara braunii]|eukprot:GBG79303.1 hypothetical protein CBR_g29452 [Chara braunii]